MDTYEKLVSFIGLAKKAGAISVGKDATYESITKGNAKLILLAHDLSERSFKDIKKIADENNICIIRSSIMMSQYELVLNKRAGIICIKNNGFADKIKKLCETI